MYRVERMILRRDAEDAEGTSGNASTRSQRSAGLGIEKTSLNRSCRRRRSRLIEWALVAIVVLYAAGLLVAPLVGIVFGAFAEGVGAVLHEITSVDALSSLKLTLIM